MLSQSQQTFQKTKAVFFHNLQIFRQSSLSFSQFSVRGRQGVYHFLNEVKDVKERSTELRLLCNNNGLLDSNFRNIFKSHHPHRLSDPLSMVTRKNYSANKNGPVDNGPPIPPLMNLRQVIWPTHTSISDWLFATVTIVNNLDPKFNPRDFIVGAKQTLVLVSRQLSTGDVKDLEALIESSAFKEIQINLAKYTDAEREGLQVEGENIFFTFPYQTKIASPSVDVTNLEITVVFHALRRGEGPSTRQETHEAKTLWGFADHSPHRIMVCNYKFLRSFVKGKDSFWTINGLNHFIPPHTEGLSY